MNKIFFLLAAFGLSLLASCKSDADLPPLERYQRDLAESLATTSRNNNIFLGLELGMPRRGYFDRCTVLNKNKEITMGAGGNAVDYKLKDELPRLATMTFAPDFGEDRKSIKAMTVLVSYDDWSPWNKASHADQMLKDLYPFLKETYGGGFYLVPHDDHGSVLVQLEDNRRIAAWVKDERFVQVRITDLSVLPDEELGYRVGI